MNTGNAPAFRSAMGGFNKKDVTDYIAKLCHDYEASINERDSQLSALRSELEALKAKLDELTPAAPADELSDTSLDPAAELDKANAVISAQCEQLAALKEELNTSAAELDATKESLKRYASLESKLAQYDSMTSRMGEIYMEATADAERIRSEARLASDAMLAKTEIECDERRALTEEQLAKFAQKRKSELACLFDETQTEINRVLTAFAEKSRVLSNRTLAQSLESFSTAPADSSAE